ncbi:MAG: TPM domain-containing protein [Thermodesulfobacteriota bacterium]
MKKVFSFFILLFCCLTIAAYGLDVPKLQGYVNDYAEMISPSAKSKIEEELKAFEQSDSTQIVILTIPSLEGENIEEFSIKVAEVWKIGQKQRDNGILLTVSKQERKIRIEVGRGLEGRLTDLMAVCIDRCNTRRIQSRAEAGSTETERFSSFSDLSPVFRYFCPYPRQPLPYSRRDSGGDRSSRPCSSYSGPCGYPTQHSLGLGRFWLRFLPIQPLFFRKVRNRSS